MSEDLLTVGWKLHSYKGVWTLRHLTADGRTTLCAVKIPKHPWGITHDSDHKRPCKNCALHQAITLPRRSVLTAARSASLMRWYRALKR